MTSSRRILLNALALAGLGLAAAGPLHAQERVRIGFMSPLTGPQAASGIDNRDGAQLAIKALNARAMYEHEAVIPAMEAARQVADELEGRVGKEYWPMPSYADLLFYV